MHYLDHNATSALRPEAREAMLRAMDLGGNPSSIHASGRKARMLIEEARTDVARFTHADPQNIIFTSGGTESNALALWGAVQGAYEADARITRLFISAIEHDSIRANAAAMAERFAGLRLETFPVTKDGVIDLAALRQTMMEGKGRALIAVMAANNETGIIQPLDEIATIARAYDARLLVDAVQAAGKIPLSLDADYLTLSAHKLGGPQGVGALVLKAGAAFAPFTLGGGQERSLRAGTENVSGITGFAAAIRAASDLRSLQNLRDQFEAELNRIAPDTIFFGMQSPRLPNTSNFALPGINAETAIMALDLDGVMISSGAACSSGKVRSSHVLAAMGVSEDIARCALRLSLGWNSTEADIHAALKSLNKLHARHSRVAA